LAQVEIDPSFAKTLTSAILAAISRHCSLSPPLLTALICHQATTGQYLFVCNGTYAQASCSSGEGGTSAQESLARGLYGAECEACATTSTGTFARATSRSTPKEDIGTASTQGCFAKEAFMPQLSRSYVPDECSGGFIGR